MICNSLISQSNKIKCLLQVFRLYLLFKKMEKDLEEIKQINTRIKNFNIQLTLLDQAIKILLSNSDTSECFEGLYTFDQFSEPVKNTFQSVSEVYEEIQNIVNQKNNSKIEMAAQRLLIDENNNFIFKYGVLKKNKLEFKSQILLTKQSVKQSLKQGQLLSQIQSLKQKNVKLQNTLQKVLIRLQKVEKILQIHQNKQKLPEKKQDQEKIIQQKNKIQKKIDNNIVELKLQNNNKILCRIQSEEGIQFQSKIQKQNIPEDIAFIYPQISDLYKQFAHILNKENKKIQGKKITIDKNFNIQFQVEIERAEQKIIKKGVIKTKAVQLNRLQKIQKVIRKNDKKQNQFTADIEETLFKKINRISQDETKLSNELANLGNKFTQRIDYIQRSLKAQVLEMAKVSNKYFDVTHPNFDKFTVTNNRIVHKFNNNTFIHIMSPIRISSTFTTYSYKVITSPSYNIMYGIASGQLKNNQLSVYSSKEFIGYYGVENGYVYDQNIKGGAVNKGGIKAGDQIKIVVDLNARKISWFKNGTQIYFSNIPQTLAQKNLYPALILYNTGDTVQMNL